MRRVLYFYLSYSIQLSQLHCISISDISIVYIYPTKHPVCDPATGITYRFKPIYFIWIVKQAKHILIALHGTNVSVFSFFFCEGETEELGENHRAQPEC